MLSFIYSPTFDLNWRDSSGFAPLHYAVKSGSPQVIQVLIDYGADRDVRSKLSTGYLTPVLLAVKEGQVDCMKTLINNNADLTLESRAECADKDENENDYGILAMSVYENQPKCLEYLVSLDKDLWKSLEEGETDRHLERGTTMGFAALCGRTECVQILLENGTSPGEDFNDVTHAICLAAGSGHLEIIKLLLDKNLHSDLVIQDHITKVEEEAMFKAAILGYDDIFIQLVEAGFRTDFSGCHSALHASAVHGHINCLKVFIERCKKYQQQEEGAIRIKDAAGKSALWYAANRGYPKCIEILISAGAWPVSFNDGIDIISCTLRHVHCCVNCREYVCVCYFSNNPCQVEGNTHESLHQYSDQETEREREVNGCIIHDGQYCNCDLAKSIEVLCEKALAFYGHEKQLASEILNRSLSICIWFDLPETLKWVLSQGANPTELVTMELNNDLKTYPLFASVSAKSLKCFNVLLEYGRTLLSEMAPIDLTICAPHNDKLPIIYWVIEHDMTDNADFMKSLLEAGCNPNERHVYETEEEDEGPGIIGLIEPDGIRPIVRAVLDNRRATKVMLLHGVSATLHPGERLILDAPLSSEALRCLGAEARLLIAAGFNRDVVLENFAPNIYWRYEDVLIKLTPDDLEYMDQFVADMTRKRSLQELCRDAIGQHLMSIHPNTNLFCLMPKLVVPGHEIWMKDSYFIILNCD